MHLSTYNATLNVAPHNFSPTCRMAPIPLVDNRHSVNKQLTKDMICLVLDDYCSKFLSIYAFFLPVFVIVFEPYLPWPANVAFYTRDG